MLAAVAYDEELAERVRSALGPVKRVTEIRMFGGLCFAVNGNMAVGVLKDELLVRMLPEDGRKALKEPSTRPMDFTGRPMDGFLFVGPAGTANARSLKKWVARGVGFASSLPPKEKVGRRRGNRASRG
jgi:hypothetical protein